MHRFRKSLFLKCSRISLIIFFSSLLLAFGIFGFIKLFAAGRDYSVRVNQDDDLYYYITVHSDGIDHEGTESSDSTMIREDSGITTVTDVLPEGLTFEGFVTTEDGTFGAVSRSDDSIACSGRVIDDTNDASVDEGTWNSDNSEYTYHGLHYTPANRTVSFRTRAITAGCKLVVGVKTHTPILAPNQARMDFWNTANFIDDSIISTSNTVHAYIEQPLNFEGYTVSYKYVGTIPPFAPNLPPTTELHSLSDTYTVADKPSLEGYVFRGWYWDYSSFQTGNAAEALGGHLPGRSVEFYGDFVKITPGADPTPESNKYRVRYNYVGKVPSAAPELPSTAYYPQGDSVSYAAAPSIDCYSFDGWNYYPNNNPFASSGIITNVQNNPGSISTMPGSDIDLYGEFTWTCDTPEPDNPPVLPSKYSVNYEVEGEMPDDFVVPRTRNYYAGTSVILDANKADDVIDGYSFSGWESDDITVDSEETFTMPSRNVLLRGNFSQESYTVSYAFDGDLPDNADSLLPSSSEYHAGELVTIADNVSHEGYEFSGWISSSTFEMPESDVVIRGIWTKIKTEFHPDISISISNPKDAYLKNDAVLFDITVTNDQDFALNDVWLEELLDGVEFIESDSYSVTDIKFATISSIPAHSSATLNARFPVSLNINKTWTNPVSLITFEAGDDNYILASDWNNTVSVDFKTEATDSEPIDPDPSTDPDPEPSETPSSSPKTNDDISLYIVSFSIVSASCILVIFIWKKHRSTFVKFYSCGAIVLGTLATLVFVNHGVFFADALNLTEELSFTSVNATDSEPGGWQVRESAEWTGVGEATLNYEITTGSIDDLRNKDVIIVLDNSNWTANDVDATPIDHPGDPTAMDIMESEVNEYIEKLLEFNDSTVTVLPAWGNDIIAKSQDVDSAKNFVNNIRTTQNTSANAYVSAYRKVYDLLENFERTSGNDLVVFFIMDDHTATNTDIANYRLLKNRIGNGKIVGIGFGIESLRERYTDASSARSENIARFWSGSDDNAHDTGYYGRIIDGLEKISDEHSTPFSPELNSSMSSHTGDPVTFDNFVLNTKINTDEFDIDKIGISEGAYSKAENSITWDLSNEIISGTRGGYIMSVILKAKDSAIERHKLYALNSETHVSTSTDRTASEDVLNSDKIVLMNGYDLSYSINNNGVCELGNNSSSVVWAMQRIIPDEENVTCAGWNFDSFKDIETGIVYTGEIPSRMPSKDLSLAAVWRKTDVEITMNETVHVVAPAKLMKGSDLADRLSEIKNSNGDSYSTIMLRSDNCPSYAQSDDHLISAPDSPTPIYAYKIADNNYVDVNPNTDRGTYTYSNPTYYCTEADEIYVNEDPSRMFAGYYYYYDEDVANWNISNTTSLADLSLGGRSLNPYRRIMEWDVSNVVDLSGLFRNFEMNADMKAEVDETWFSNWDISNVKTLDYMYSGSVGVLGSIPFFDNMDVSNVESMANIFSSSRNNDYSVIANWNVSNVKNLNSAFSQANITDLSVLSKWDVSNVEQMANTFYQFGWRNKKSIEGIRGWKVSNVTNMSGLFGRTYIESLEPLSKWDTAKVTDMSSLFNDACIPTSLHGLEDWNTDSVTNLSSAFKYYHTTQSAYEYCPTDITVDLFAISGWNTANVTGLNETFRYLPVENFNALSGWNVANVGLMNNAFSDNSKLTNISAFSGWTTTNLTNLDSAFANDISLADFSPLSGWDTSKVAVMDSAFSNTAIASLEPFLGWTMPSLTSMESIFENHKFIQSLHGLENWDVSKVGSFKKVFRGYSGESENNTNWSTFCNNQLSDISAISSWNVTSGVNFESMFACDDKITSLTALSNWKPTYAKYFVSFLEGAKGIKSLNGIENLGHVEQVEQYQRANLAKAFKYMSNLEDITAVGNWNVEIDRVDETFWDDRKIQSLEELNNWNMFSGVIKRNTFDNIPDSITRPDWY